MSQTKIEWADKVWNPITGCSPVSDGCRNCYARRMANRLKGRYGYPKDDPFRVTFHPDRLDEPLHWIKPSRIFVSSMGDLFHESIHPETIDVILESISFSSRQGLGHTFLILTKRPAIMRRQIEESAVWGNNCWNFKESIWLGVSVEDQKTADERLPILLQIPAAHRFVSLEPMLGPVDLRGFSAVTHEKNDPLRGCGTNLTRLDWVICGGETGPKARPLHPDWIRSLRDQCQAAGVPFFLKGWGEWGYSFTKGAKERAVCSVDGQTLPMIKNEEYFRTEAKHKICGGTHQCMYQTGKKKAGRLLDGREWNEIPKCVGEL